MDPRALRHIEINKGQSSQGCHVGLRKPPVATVNCTVRTPWLSLLPVPSPLRGASEWLRFLLPPLLGNKVSTKEKTDCSSLMQPSFPPRSSLEKAGPLPKAKWSFCPFAPHSIYSWRPPPCPELWENTLHVLVSHSQALAELRYVLVFVLCASPQTPLARRSLSVINSTSCLSLPTCDTGFIPIPF